MTGRLFCHIYDELMGTQAPKMFPIVVREDARVDDLRVAVEEKRPDRLAGLHYANVGFYNVAVVLRDLTTPIVIEDRVPMLPSNRWSDYITDADLKMVGILHVVVAINALPG